MLSKEGVLIDKCKSEEIEKAYRKTDGPVVPMKGRTKGREF